MSSVVCPFSTPVIVQRLSCFNVCPNVCPFSTSVNVCPFSTTVLYRLSFFNDCHNVCPFSTSVNVCPLSTSVNVCPVSTSVLTSVLFQLLSTSTVLFQRLSIPLSTPPTVNSATSNFETHYSTESAHQPSVSQ